MKLQPKCNFSVVNKNILQKINGYNAFCQNVVQQNFKENTDSTLTQKELLGTESTTVATVTKETTSTQAVASTKSEKQSETQSNECSKTKTQTTTCPKTTTGTKETQNTETTKNTQTTSSANNSNNGTSSTSFKEFQKKVIELVNNERANAGLSALSENSDLNNVATIKSEDMVKSNYFSHTSPTYGSPFQMLTQFNISYTAAGENIAYGQSTPEEVMNGWMNSPGHKANILNLNFTQIGVGVAQKANGQYVWTQEFLRP